MADVENVIYAIERCTCHVPDACRDCPYDAGHPYNECVEMLLKDVLELLKEHEPVKAIDCRTPYTSRLKDADVVFTNQCGYCSMYILKNWKACPLCGRKIKWDE